MSVLITDERPSPALERVRGMAPDHATLRTADELARSDKWKARGASRLDDGRRLLWAEFPDSTRPPIHTIVSLPDLYLSCSCAATRFPCRHLIALLMWSQAAGLDAGAELTDGDAPEWAIAAERERPIAEPTDDESSDDDPSGARLAALVTGLADLGRWLGDIADLGLAALPRKNRAIWLEAADRLVDAYAVETARELREMAAIPGSGADWPERLLARMGRLALLCEAFQRFQDMPAVVRGDMLAAVGYRPLPLGQFVEDEWLVAGFSSATERRETRSRTWLYGRRSGRWALLNRVMAAGRNQATQLPVGATVSGSVAFYDSAWPCAARAEGDLRIIPDRSDFAIPAAAGINEAIGGYAAALAANPWLASYPLALGEVSIEPPSAAAWPTWRVRDRAGWLLPLPANFGHGWRLLSLAAHRRVTLFGEWDGETFTPVSVLAGAWQSMSGWRSLS